MRVSRKMSHVRALAALLSATVVAGCGYGRIQELDELARSARTEIEVQLQRRAELVPNLIETVSDYGALSEDVIAPLADARARLVGAVRSGDLRAMEVGSARLSGAIGRLLGVAGRYPALELDAGFRLLLSQLDGTESQIRSAGQAYNDAVLHYNDYISHFPQLLTAKVVGAKQLQLVDLWKDVPLIRSASE